MSLTTATEACESAPKFSRYRSVRKAVAAASPESAPAVPLSSEEESHLNRAPSRYHRANRRRTATTSGSAQPSNDTATKSSEEQSPVVQHSPKQKPSSPKSVKEKDSGDRTAADPVSDVASPRALSQRKVQHHSKTTSGAVRPTTNAQPQSYDAAREEARMILEGEYDRSHKSKEAPKPYDPKKDPNAPSRSRRPTQTQAQTQGQTQIQAQMQPPKSEAVYFDAPKLNKARKVERKLPEKYHDAPQPVRQRPRSPPQRPTLSTSQEPKQNVSSKSVGLERHATVSAQRKFDAPVSAVNAGDRRVEVRLGLAAHGITLPVTPTTNSKDLLNSASVVMSENFDPRSSILVESFSQMGLERPLRRYEHIRDVMNSWDSDDQNYLTIMTESEVQATGLEKSEAPSEPPTGVLMLQMHLSQRSGKWDKRWIILRSDGQVTMSKHENDGEGTNICHLSDFDVYTPTHRQRKKIKPPKKICFAVKSQQKSAMFLEGLNYVHFFSTSDRKVADQWYSAVQSWRSWYLVHVLGEGTQKPKEPVTATIRPAASNRPQTAQSSDSVPYQLGSFKPLLDFSDLDFGASPDMTHAESMPKNNSPSQKPSIDLGLSRPSIDNTGNSEAFGRGSRQKGMPPSAFPAKLFSDAETKGRSSLDNSDQAFTGGGLLGRSASKRSQGGKASGQGMTRPAGKPLVDLREASDFAEGSLLRQLEAWSVTQGDYEPRIDRQRRIEANVRVGEAV